MDTANLVVQALVSRAVASDVPPLAAKEFWPLWRSGDVGELLGQSADSIATSRGLAGDVAERVARLLNRSSAITLATEQLEHTGFWTLAPSDDAYPARVMERLGDSAPPLFFGVGETAHLALDGLGVVGSRDIPPEAAEVAGDVARFAAKKDLPLVSGGARGIDQQSMNAAFEAGGNVVGVLADSLTKSVTQPSTRRAIGGGQISLMTPYAPSAGFSVGNAMGRNKIIYALSKAVVVVRSDEGSGGTWAGAVEALRNKTSNVISWTGPGTGPGNAELVAQGARDLPNIDSLPEALDSDAAKAGRQPTGDQLAIF